MNTANPYVTPYILMEYKNAIIGRCADFYFWLKNDAYKTVGDALNYWSQRFNNRDNAVILQLMGKLFHAGSIDLNDPQAKPKALREIWHAIVSLTREFQEIFVDCGEDRTKCSRAKVSLDLDVKDFDAELKRFLHEFEKIEEHRANCSVDDLVLNRCAQQSDEFVKLPEKITKTECDAIHKFKPRLERLKVGKAQKTCKECALIGDVVISLQAPRHMTLNHTDKSFDYLCPVTQQRHRKLDTPQTFDKKRKA